MRNWIILASLVAVPAVALSQPAPRQPPPPPPPHRGCATGLTMPDDRCAPTGTPLVELDQLRRSFESQHPAPQPISTLRLYDNGAWTFVEVGTPGRTATGYLDARALKIVRDDLARATWKTSQLDVTCAAISPTYTDVHVRGKAVWTDAVCSGAVLDDVSAKSIAEIRKLLDDATAAKPAAACAPLGTPVVELDFLDARSDVAQRTVAVYVTGASTLDVKQKGQPDVHETRCLAAPELAKIEGLLAVPWKTTRLPNHCMAKTTSLEVVKISGAPVFTEEMCGAEVLDPASAKSLAELDRLLAPAAATTPACAPSGRQLVELDFIDDIATAPQATVRLFASGGWTFDETTKTKATRSFSGCLGKDAVATIIADVDAAPWQVTRKPIACRAYGSRSTAIKIDGKLVFTERACSGDVLDADSAKRLAEIEKLLDVATSHRTK